MIKLLILFKKPFDTETFLQHYHKEFLPTAKTLPKLTSLATNWVRGEASGGEPTYFAICELTFATKEAFKVALQSASYRTLGTRLAVLGPGLSTILVTEVNKPVGQNKRAQLTEFEELTL